MDVYIDTSGGIGAKSSHKNCPGCCWGTLGTVAAIVLELHPAQMFLTNGGERRKEPTRSLIDLNGNAFNVDGNIAFFGQSHGWQYCGWGDATTRSRKRSRWCNTHGLLHQMGPVKLIFLVRISVVRSTNLLLEKAHQARMLFTFYLLVNGSISSRRC